MNEDLQIEIKTALTKQPEWVAQRALMNAEKYARGTLISKYESKDIEPLKEEDIIKPESLSEEKKKELKELGIQHLKESSFAYFTMAGGISTSMGGCSKAVLLAKQNKTFLEIKLDHIRYTQKKYNCKIPFIIMTNEETDTEITDFLKQENRLQDIDLIKIIQPITIRFEEENNNNHNKDNNKDNNEEIKLKVAKLNNGEISYAPGGHYDSFILLKEIKHELKEKGIKTIYLNNIDNLGSTIDPLLLGMHLQEQSFFTPEIARKEANDKGGTFARISGNLRLLEGPMVPEDYKQKYEDTSTNKYFNTNLIYINTEILEHFEEINNQVPTFINRKIIDGKKMFGFEGAIGLVFGIKKSALIEVSRKERFLPIKFLSDLLLLRSNFMILDEETSCVYQIKDKKPLITIPETFLGNLEDFNKKIADGGETTNFKDLDSLTWRAKDGKIGSRVTFKGNVTITEQNSIIKDDEVIE